MFAKIKSILLIFIMIIAIIPVAFSPDVADSINKTDGNTTRDETSDDTVDDGREDETSDDTSDDGREDETSDDTSDDGSDDSTDETEIGDETEVIDEDEMNIISNGFGAKMRLLQLQKRVELQAEGGQLIIERINEVKPEFDTSRLEEIVNEFNVLIGLIEDYDLNQPQDVLVQDYVSMKKQAIDLSHEFKMMAKDALSNKDKEALKKNLEQKQKQYQERKDAKIEELKLKYDLDKINQIATKLGYDVETAQKRLLAGEITIAQIKQKLADDYRALDENKKKEIQNSVKEAKIKNNIQVKEKKQELVQKAEERRAELVQKAEERRAELVQKAEERRAELVQKAEERRQEMLEKAQEKKDRLHDDSAEEEELEEEEETESEELEEESSDNETEE